MTETETLYGVPAAEFVATLERTLNEYESYTATDILFIVLEVEIKLLNEHYDRLRATRDERTWLSDTAPLAMRVLKKLQGKRAKLERYNKEL